MAGYDAERRASVFGGDEAGDATGEKAPMSDAVDADADLRDLCFLGDSR